jgi:hypothetical protein
MNSTRSVFTAHIMNNQYMCGSESKKNSLHGVVALCTRMRISLDTSTMLNINCPVPTSPFSPCPHPNTPPNPRDPLHHMRDIFKLVEDDIGMLGNILCLAQLFNSGLVHAGG